ncbi:hypothetical protein H1C71_036538 [Ictidomys tridecemlineatus]|nr:hypothetical protein H1C71_036538 [Ictidomys tridecemlineatus]
MPGAYPGSPCLSAHKHKSHFFSSSHSIAFGKAEEVEQKEANLALGNQATLSLHHFPSSEEMEASQAMPEKWVFGIWRQQSCSLSKSSFPVAAHTKLSSQPQLLTHTLNLTSPMQGSMRGSESFRDDWAEEQETCPL